MKTKFKPVQRSLILKSDLLVQISDRFHGIACDFAKAISGAPEVTAVWKLMYEFGMPREGSKVVRQDYRSAENPEAKIIIVLK